MSEPVSQGKGRHLFASECGQGVSEWGEVSITAKKTQENGEKEPVTQRVSISRNFRQCLSGCRGHPIPGPGKKGGQW